MQESQKQTIDLGQLCGLVFNLMCHSCQILRQFAGYGHLIWKDKSNPVTQVDFLIQSYLNNSIKAHFGDQTLKIIGEEDLMFTDVPHFKAIVNDKLDSVKLSQRIHQLSPLFSFKESYEMDKLCLWVDPIDCTAGFTNNRLYQVTVLIGISYKGIPICGFIGHPFQKQGDKNIYHPTVVLGSTAIDCQCAFEYDVQSETWIKIMKPQDQSSRKTAISCRDICQPQIKLMKELEMQPIKVSGAGYKILKVIKNEVSSVFLMNAVTSKWDSCAGEAIITAMGGHVVTPTLGAIQYGDQAVTSNYQGFLMTTNTHLFDRFSKLVRSIHQTTTN